MLVNHFALADNLHVQHRTLAESVIPGHDAADGLPVVRRSHAGQETERSQVDAEQRTKLLFGGVRRAQNGPVAAEHHQHLAAFSQFRHAAAVRLAE